MIKNINTECMTQDEILNTIVELTNTLRPEPEMPYHMREAQKLEARLQKLVKGFRENECAFNDYHSYLRQITVDSDDDNYITVRIVFDSDDANYDPETYHALIKTVQLSIYEELPYAVILGVKPGTLTGRTESDDFPTIEIEVFLAPVDELHRTKEEI